MNTDTLNNPLWLFATAFYQLPTAAETLLRLQDEHQLNVNILLLLIWLGDQDKTMSAEQLAAIISLNAALDSDIISPLRQSRRALKQQPTLHHYYQALKNIELGLEQEAMRALYQHCEGINFQIVETSALEINLSLYILQQSAAFDDLNSILLRYHRQKSKNIR